MSEKEKPVQKNHIFKRFWLLFWYIFLLLRFERAKNCSNMIFSALRIFLMVLWRESRNSLYQMFQILLRSFFYLDNTSFEIIHTGMGDWQFAWQFFMYDHSYYNAKCALKFSPCFKLIRSCPLLKMRIPVRTSWNRIWRLRCSMKQFGVPYVKRKDYYEN